jgi:Phosphoesterase family
MTLLLYPYSLFERKIGLTFTNKETVLELNGCRIEAYPSNHIDAYRALDNPKFILLDATYQQGHPAISDALEEQIFLVNTLNRLQKLPGWNNTAVIITYDDSDGWYDQVMPRRI